MLFSSFSFPNKLISFKRRVNCINDHSAAVEMLCVISSSQLVSSGYNSITQAYIPNKILVNKTDRALYLLINKAKNTTTQHGNHSLVFAIKGYKMHCKPSERARGTGDFAMNRFLLIAVYGSFLVNSLALSRTDYGKEEKTAVWTESLRY